MMAKRIDAALHYRRLIIHRRLKDRWWHTGGAYNRRVKGRSGHGTHLLSSIEEALLWLLLLLLLKLRCVDRQWRSWVEGRCLHARGNRHWHRLDEARLRRSTYRMVGDDGVVVVGDGRWNDAEGELLAAALVHAHVLLPWKCSEL